MLPSFYQSCLQAQLSETQFVTLEVLVELLQEERRITIERLATLFPQPILFESRRRNIQRFLRLPQLTPQALWFPIIKQWIKRHFKHKQRLHLVIDRTQWQDHNLIMVSVVYQHRAIPLHWVWLDKQGQSSLSEQQKVLRPVLRLLKKHCFVLLGDREFHSIELAAWCVEKRVNFVFRLPKSTTVKTNDSNSFTRLDDLPQTPGLTEQYLQIQVTQKRGFGKHNLVLRQKRTYRQSNEDAWYLLTNLTDAAETLKAYSHRFCIEPLFKDYKSGGYHLEDCQADLRRFTALLVLIAIAYSTRPFEVSGFANSKCTITLVVSPNQSARPIDTVTFGLVCMAVCGLMRSVSGQPWLVNSWHLSRKNAAFLSEVSTPFL